MKYKIPFLLLLLSICIRAQSIQWLDTIKNSTINHITGLEKDSLGFIYTAGNFSPKHQDPSPRGIFVSKYDTLGNIIWSDIKNVDVVCLGNVVDNAGNLYALFKFSSSGSITFGSYSFTVVGLCDLILVKYNTLGIVLWAKKVNHANPKGISMGLQGQIYIYGHCTDSTNFDSQTTGINGNFIARYNINGTCQMVFSSSLEVVNVAPDNAGNVFLVDRAGTSSGFYLKKYSSSGLLIWAKPLPVDGQLCTDKSGNCYLRGAFIGGVTFGSNTLVNPFSNGAQWFLAKFNTIGNNIWAITPSDSLTFLDLFITSSTLYLTGGSGNNSGLTSGGLYVLRIDTNGVTLGQNNYISGVSGTHITYNANSVYVAGNSWGMGSNNVAFLTKISTGTVAGATNVSLRPTTSYLI